MLIDLVAQQLYDFPFDVENSKSHSNEDDYEIDDELCPCCGGITQYHGEDYSGADCWKCLNCDHSFRTGSALYDY